MSGIFGVHLLQDENLLQGWLDALEEGCRIYGQADSGCVVLDNVAMGCHLEHFAENYPISQPILRDGSKIAVLDALLYNREELLPLLHLQATASDEEIMLQLLLQKGPEALKRVNGDFAGAIYDEEEESWLLFRDQMGVRPLYVYKKENHFAFINGKMNPQLSAHGKVVDEPYADGRFSVNVGDLCILTGITTRPVTYTTEDGKQNAFVSIDMPTLTPYEKDGEKVYPPAFEGLTNEYEKDGEKHKFNWASLINGLVYNERKAEIKKVLEGEKGEQHPSLEEQMKNATVKAAAENADKGKSAPKMEMSL